MNFEEKNESLLLQSCVKVTVCHLRKVQTLAVKENILVYLHECCICILTKLDIEKIKVI